MRILVVLTESPAKRILITLCKKQHIKELKELVGQRAYSRAIDVILKNGKLEKEVELDALENLRVDLILKKDSAHWDLMEKR